MAILAVGHRLLSKNTCSDLLDPAVGQLLQAIAIAGAHCAGGQEKPDNARTGRPDAKILQSACINKS